MKMMLAVHVATGHRSVGCERGDSEDDKPGEHSGESYGSHKGKSGASMN